MKQISYGMFSDLVSLKIKRFLAEELEDKYLDEWVDLWFKIDEKERQVTDQD